MPGRKQPRGKCGYCERDFSVGGMTRHLSACPKRKRVLAETDRKRGRNSKLYHLRAQALLRREFWLDLEVNGSVTLSELDNYLRDIWLECCGHLSRFSEDPWMSGDIPMSARVSDIFKPGGELIHTYDFGNSSYTHIRCVAHREGKPVNHPRSIALMSRNNEPDEICIGSSCDKRAVILCIECVYEDDVWGTLCDLHTETHPHEDVGTPAPLVNSPRIGMCGYEGPAAPPY